MDIEKVRSVQKTAGLLRLSLLSKLWWRIRLLLLDILKYWVLGGLSFKLGTFRWPLFSILDLNLFPGYSPQASQSYMICAIIGLKLGNDNPSGETALSAVCG